MNVFYDTRMGVLQKQRALVNSAMGNVGREFHVVRNHIKFVKSNLIKKKHVNLQSWLKAFMITV